MHLSKSHRLSDPVATTGDRLYVVSTQNGLFPDFASLDHAVHEMGGVWDHPIKLLDGYWFALRNKASGSLAWLTEADSCEVHATHTEFTYRLGAIRITRKDFVPDGIEGLVVTLTIHAPERWQQNLELLALCRSDLRPVWLGEATGLIDHPDQAEIMPDQRTVIFKDDGNPWYAAITSNVLPHAVEVGAQVPAPQPTVGQGASALLTLPLPIDAAGFASASLFVAGSMQSAAVAIDTLHLLRNELDTLITAKTQLCQRIETTSHLISPDTTINQAFAWSKLNCQRHLRDVPGVGRGVGAGLPGYPWWFGIDSEYAILPMLQAGLFDQCKETLRLIKDHSEKRNPGEPGRVIHELVTNGAVYNEGNLVETPAFTRAVYQTWQWTGDQAFLAEMYPFCKAGLLDYTLGTCDPDGDLCPSGRSIIETLEMHAGFECIDVAAHTWEALGFVVEMAGALGDVETALAVVSLVSQLGERIRREWWLEEEGLFADVRATPQEVKNALAHLDAIGKNIQDEGFHAQRIKAHELFAFPQSLISHSPISNLDSHWSLRHWVVFTPAEVGLATPVQAQRLLDRMSSPEFFGEWGMYLHPDRHEAMSINTGLLALAEVRYGRIAQAQRIVSLLASQLNVRTPGSISEALPDQWCFLQLWSAVGVISPVVEGFLGIEPHAALHKLRVVPNLPDGWDEVALHQLRVADVVFDIRVQRSQQQATLSVASDDPVFQLELGTYLPAGTKIKTVLLNNQPTEWCWQETNRGHCVVCQVAGSGEVMIVWG